jgi:hypothetical protein
MLKRTLLCLALAGCAGGVSPSPDAEEPTSIEPVSAASAEAEPAHGRIEAQGPAPFLSRYSPTFGVVGTTVKILGSFAAVTTDNVVTIGGVPASVKPESFVLEAVVPYGAVSGPLCVTANGQTVCGEDFTVLAGPVIYSVSAEPHARAETVLELSGAGFVQSSVVLLDGLPLDTSLTEYAGLEAVLPMGTASGTHQLSVKNGLRCGPESLPFPISL